MLIKAACLKHCVPPKIWQQGAAIKFRNAELNVGNHSQRENTQRRLSATVQMFCFFNRLLNKYAIICRIKDLPLSRAVERHVPETAGNVHIQQTALTNALLFRVAADESVCGHQ